VHSLVEEGLMKTERQECARHKRPLLNKKSPRLRVDSNPGPQPPALDLDLLEERVRQVLRGKLGNSPRAEERGQPAGCIDRHQLQEAVRREVRRQLGAAVAERDPQAKGRGEESDQILLEGVVRQAIRRALVTRRIGQEGNGSREELSPRERLELEARVRQQVLRRLRPNASRSPIGPGKGDLYVDRSLLEERIREEITRQLAYMSQGRPSTRKRARPKQLDLDVQTLASQVRSALVRCLVDHPPAQGRLTDRDIDSIILAALDDLPVRKARA
jgi:hypothetical protein